VLQGLRYWRCARCEATFLDPAHRPAPARERAHYLGHDNDAADEGYRRFLGKLARPLLARLAPGRDGLDYGCGPGPALAGMLREAGHRVRLYDPFFFPDPAALERSYDFIACSEAAEHFHRPAEEFVTLDRLLRPGGWLAVMTCFQTDDARFADWHYRRDPTHVVFYRAATLRRIADRHGWRCEIPVKDVALMRKAPAEERDHQLPS
jgi:SAM-dependent methyltransferase